MNISGSSNAIASLGSIQGLQRQPLGSPADADDSGTSRPHRMHGGGHMRQAVMQALQSLGLTAPQDASGSSAAGTASGSGSSGSSDPGAATAGIKQDMQQFMHSLFEAVKGESSAAASSSSSSDPRSTFADGLSTLISQVSSGSAPADLQSAFSKLASDLQTAGFGSTSTSADGSAGTVQATLQAFLTHLQQDLGFGSTTSASAIGNLVTAQV